MLGDRELVVEEAGTVTLTLSEWEALTGLAFQAADNFATGSAEDRAFVLRVSALWKARAAAP